jgi:hypothetical protein
MDSILERAGKSLGLGTALLLMVSVAFDCGYLRAIGLSFVSVPTSLTDHVRTAIIWAPVMGVPALFGFVFGFGLGAESQHDLLQVDMRPFAATMEHNPVTQSTGQTGDNRSFCRIG